MLSCCTTVLINFTALFIPHHTVLLLLLLLLLQAGQARAKKLLDGKEQTTEKRILADSELFTRVWVADSRERSLIGSSASF